GAAAAPYAVDAQAAARRGADIREDAALPRRREAAAPETAVIVACGKGSRVEPSCDPAAEGGPANARAADRDDPDPDSAAASVADSQDLAGGRAAPPAGREHLGDSCR